MKAAFSLLLMISLFTISSMALVAKADSGTASATMTLVVPVQTIVSCASPSVTASPGTNSMAVTCTITGNPNNLASGTANTFGPSTVTMTNGSGQTLMANLQSTVTSPDSTVTSISGSSTGFSGTLQSLPAKVQAVYNVNTTASTQSGTYTGATTYTWSTL